MHISEVPEKILKKSFVSEIMALEIVAINSAYCYRNSCHRQFMRLKTVLRLHIRLKKSFCNSIYPELTRKDSNSGAVVI